MSARVLNPASTKMMTEIGRNSQSSNNSSRVMPSRAALARVRRDLFGPVDHAAARAFAERELRAQAILDADKWGFDFKLEMPRSNSRYDWQAVPTGELIPEPYAFRGMPYIKKHAPSSPEAQRSLDEDDRPLRRVVAATISMESPTERISRVAISEPPATPPTDVVKIVRESERTPPQNEGTRGCHRLDSRRGLTWPRRRRPLRAAYPPRRYLLLLKISRDPLLV